MLKALKFPSLNIAFFDFLIKTNSVCLYHIVVRQWIWSYNGNNVFTTYVSNGSKDNHRKTLFSPGLCSSHSDVTTIECKVYHFNDGCTLLTPSGYYYNWREFTHVIHEIETCKTLLGSRKFSFRIGSLISAIFIYWFFVHSLLLSKLFVVHHISTILGS